MPDRPAQMLGKETGVTRSLGDPETDSLFSIMKYCAFSPAATAVDCCLCHEHRYRS